MSYMKIANVVKCPLPPFENLTGCDLYRDVVGQEHVGTAFPHIFYVLLYNEFEAVLIWLVFWLRSHISFVSTTVHPWSCSISRGSKDALLNIQYAIVDVCQCSFKYYKITILIATVTQQT